MPATMESEPAPKILERPDGSTIAYHLTPGKSPGVIFMTGFMSDMTGEKAKRLESHCRDAGRMFLRFDYTGHGASSGRFEDGTIGEWADDALYALDNLTEGPMVFVGSSMGGWIMLLAALKRPERAAGLLGVAPAPDFTEDLIPNELTAEQKETLERDGVVYVYSEYGPDPTPIAKKLLDEGANNLLLRGPMAIDCPVRLIHGMQDPDVPWERSMTIKELVRTDDVEVTLVKAGLHQLSEPRDLDRLIRTLDALLAHVEGA